MPDLGHFEGAITIGNLRLSISNCRLLRPILLSQLA
jgi:hypothetical protein